MKHQQPAMSSNMTMELSNTKGLRPILPKPADNLLASPFLNKEGVQILTDGSVTGLPGSIPVVILPTQIYMNMANKIAAQVAVANMAAVGVNPTFTPVATEMPSVESAREALKVEESGVIEQESDSSLSGKMATEEVIGSGCSASLAQIVQEINENNNFNVTLEQGLHEIENRESEILLNDCTKITSISSRKTCNKPVLNEDKIQNEMSAPCAKKTRTDKRKTKPGNRITTSSTASQRKQNLPQPKRSPLRPRPQPTLAAINSQANEITSPGSIFNRNNVSDFTCLSPVKPMITPTKACGNQSFLASLLVSPLGSGSSHLGFTPLNYGSDSGFFTPLKEGDMDYGFLFSPERFSMSKACSTPQSCRKSLGLGLACKGEEKKTDLQCTGYDVDFTKL